ncbi:MAG: ABC transporter permease [Acidobacteriota bacterium]
MDNLWKDIRFGLRTLVRSPATTLVALLTLALGIGANSSIFSVIDAFLLRPLPYPEADRLVLFRESAPKLGFPRFSVSPPNFADWRRLNRSFEHLSAFQRKRLSLTGSEQPESLLGAAVSPGFFELFGISPAPGRGFREEEGRPGQGRVAVLSHGLWERRFGGDPKIVGRSILLDGESYLVVGIASNDLDVPNGTDVWVPLDLDFAKMERGSHFLGVAGRLKHGVSLETATAEMVGIAAQLSKQYPDSNAEWTVVLQRFGDAAVEDIRPALLLLLIAVGFVLLIACANVANLLLARMAAREREIAVRAALGATRTRLVRQMLVETLVLFLAGGLFGLGVAWLGVKGLVALAADAVPRTVHLGVDGRMLAFTLAVSLLTGLLFGLAPSLSATGGRLYGALKEGGRAMAGGRQGRLMRGVLVGVEVGLALALLVISGLLIRSFAKLSGVDPGFKPEGVLTARLSIPESKYPDEERQALFYQQLVERLAAIPGVESAATIYPLPLSGSDMVFAYQVEGRPVEPSQQPNAQARMISPDYFRAMGIPVVKGRAFDKRDGRDAQEAAIINQTLASRDWAGQDPIGKRITFDATAEKVQWFTIVGVVGNVRHDTLDGKDTPELYLAQSQVPSTDSVVVLRTAQGDPARLTTSLREAVRELDRDLPVERVQTMEQVMKNALAPSRIKALLLGIFSVLALVLAAVGVYGVVSYSVEQRTHEIGIRMALGARPGQVRRLVILQGMRIVLVGAAFGLILAGGASRFLGSQVYGVTATDPMTFLAVPILLLAVALVANWLPALRATRVDPLEALRYE